MSNHLIEPLKIGDRGPEFIPDILDATDALIAVAADEDHAKRIIACVNACKDLPDIEIQAAIDQGGFIKILNSMASNIAKLMNHDNPKH